MYFCPKDMLRVHAFSNHIPLIECYYYMLMVVDGINMVSVFALCKMKAPLFTFCSIINCLLIG